ncbi:hypothetical protein ACFPL7_05865 [Dongia soli]|uniref:Uncharacterized protein n=1 Tax=Dongia soli TaxID=600628 RepID=A0ABU5EF18_9PROT|nr:hypothetical protein [Dongia soli]MDY0884927.1 hypothetical protein [Dongia soli]
MLGLSPRVSSRRSLLLTASALLLGTTLHRLGRQAWAQGEDDSVKQLRGYLNADRGRAEAFYKRLRNGERISEDARQDIANTSVKLRVDRANRLQAIAKSSADPDAAAKQVLYPDTGFLVGDMQRADMAALPSPDDIKPDPTKSAPRPKQKPDPAKKWQMVVTILLETLGIMEARNQFEESLRQVSGFQEEQQGVMEAFRTGTPKQMTDAVFSFIEWFVQRHVIVELLPRLAARKIAAPALHAFSLQLVPWIGWSWLLVSFGIAVHRHWDELVA